MIRGALAAALVATLAASTAFADEGRLADIRWAGPMVPTRWMARLEGADAREVELRIATKPDPVRYKAVVAFGRLAEALGSSLVPRSSLRATPLRELLEAARSDARTYAELRRDASVQNDGTVMVAMADAVRGEDADVLGGPDVATWRRWVSGVATIPDGSGALAGGYVEMLVLDYLAGNVFRRTAVVDRAARRLHLVDNRGVFFDHPDAKGLEPWLSRLREVRKFPRAFVGRLRALDRAKADALLHAGGFSDWLVPSRTIGELMDRRDAVVSLIDARIAEQGDAEALCLP